MGVTLESLLTMVNSMWVLISGFFVFFMQLGFAMLEAGSVRVKNVANIILKNIVDFCISTIAFWAVGFAFMFGNGSGFIGTTFWFMKGIPDTFAGLPVWVFWFWQLMFAGCSATIVSGGVAERIKFVNYLIYSAFISALVYPVVGRWIWGGGFLAARGMLDFAGSTVVHSVGGWAGLAGTLLLGPRIGKFDKNGKARAIPGHSMTIANIGMWVLWLGWFGFNPGSTLSMSDPGLVARIAINTNVAAAVGVLTAMCISKARTGKWDVPLSMNGCLAGLVAITAPCAYVNFVDSIVIALLGSVILVYSIILLEKLHIDDPVGAVPVHLFNGVWGTLAVGLFHETSGLFHGGGWHLLGVQALGVVCVGAWTFGLMLALFSTLKHTIGLRVSPKEEIQGLDLTEHGAPAYVSSDVTTEIAIQEGLVDVTTKHTPSGISEEKLSQKE